MLLLASRDSDTSRSSSTVMPISGSNNIRLFIYFILNKTSGGGVSIGITPAEPNDMTRAFRLGLNTLFSSNSLFPAKPRTAHSHGRRRHVPWSDVRIRVFVQYIKEGRRKCTTPAPIAVQRSDFGISGSIRIQQEGFPNRPSHPPDIAENRPSIQP